MGKLVFGMMQSLDGYVAGVAGGPGSDGYVAGVAGGLDLPPPGVSLHRHFNDLFRGLAGCDKLPIPFGPAGWIGLSSTGSLTSKLAPA